MRRINTDPCARCGVAPRAIGKRSCAPCSESSARKHRPPRRPRPPTGLKVDPRKTGARCVPVPEGLRRLLYEHHHGETGDL